MSHEIEMRSRRSRVGMRPRRIVAESLFAPIRHFFHARRRAQYLKGLQHGLFAMAPILVTVVILYLSERAQSLGIDFKYSFWPAAHRLLDGGNVYPSPNAPLIAAGEGFDYPAVGTLLLAPFGLLPNGPATFVFTAVCIMSVPVTLWILGVRDWRVYGVVMLWWPVISGWQVANTTLPLGLGIALIWRYRDRAMLVGALVALLVSAKLFLWPLVVWLLATRRYVALAYAVGCALLFNVVAWSVVGFDQLARYLRLAAAVDIYERRGAGPLAWLLSRGISQPAAYALVLTAAVIICGACYALARSGNERTALALAIGGALLASPIVWIHYYALLMVPLAIARPRVTWAWAAPCLLDVYGSLASMSTLRMGLLAVIVVCISVAVLNSRGASAFPV